ncbi:SusC/RagA family TonB-linked outer membrane protein [Sphingobacterium sp. lm-10]|uniref:SusC/RagA family TonB-linked outer membrane protein n=1 Tax=Sphingobacterium sp. lm-10 TaxID=2944904 RepID=UPI00201FD17F|nr:SusC/RagA family TonB-linked outer membrane protein [Sphingobacterium sp. lm-10]MCL7987970.1 SusC/RagA family TonB-linked outer membrane protein [Sphingobacterium sp. lm-10]
MKKHLLSFFVLFTFLTGAVFAQNRTVTGKVTSAIDGSALSGVTVLVDGTSQGTQTRSDGTYTILATQGSTLNFRYIGYTGRSVKVGATTTLDVELSLDESLEEVIVTGYANITKEKFTGSAKVIGKEATENLPIGSFNQTLQGRVPGLLMNSGSGQPGANGSVTIRGIQSIQGAGVQPLYVLDGIPVSQDQFRALNNNDIESITVLKDANAAALYGARGGTGVIVIKTKRGKEGTTDINVSSQFGITLAPDFSRLNLMSTSELLAYEERLGLAGYANNLPGWFYSRQNPRNANLSAAGLADIDRKLDSTRNINTDLRDVFFRTGLSQDHGISVRGGNQDTKYFLSTGVFKQEGIDRTSGLDKYTMRSNISHNYKGLSIDWNTMIGYSQLKTAVGDLYGNSPINPFQMIYRARPYDNPYRSDGTLNSGGGSSTINLKQVANVLERNENSRVSQNTITINTGLNLAYKITDDLTVRNVLGVDAYSNRGENYINPDSYSGSLQTYQKGFARENLYNYAQIINTTSLNYHKTINDLHEFDAGVYFEGIRTYQKGLGFTLYNLNPTLPWTGQGAAPLPTDGNATMPQNASSVSTGYGIRSYFATANYTYDSRISVNANIRRDGTSRIVNPQNKEITTWSTGLNWSLHREAFLEDVSFLDALNLRASYGVIPSIGSIATTLYQFHGLALPNYAGSQLPAFGTGSYTGSTIPGIVPTAPGNPNYQIEKVNKANIGVDVSFLESRVNLSIDVYKNVTKDLFVRQPLSGTTAFPNLDVNAGQMSNKGIEGDLKIRVLDRPENRLTLDIGANHAINVNNIDDLGTVEEYFLGTFLIREGLPYGSHYTTKYLGANPADGRPRFEQEDGSIVTDAAAASRFATFGTYLPKHIGGFNIDFGYKGFFVNSLFSYQFDVVRSNNTRNWITDGTLGYINAVTPSRELLDNQWMNPGDEKFFNSPGASRGFTSSDLQNAKFLRFRQLQVGYNIPEIKSRSGNSIIKRANVYATFHNLAVWSPWQGVDPEDDNNISLVEYPNPRMIVFGVNLTF